EGPCNPNTGICQNATTEGVNGPVACPTNDAGSGALCEFSDGECINAGTRTVLENGVATTEHMAVTGCLDNLFQNGDLDFDGTDYQARSWPDGALIHQPPGSTWGRSGRTGDCTRRSSSRPTRPRRSPCATPRPA